MTHAAPMPTSPLAVVIDDEAVQRSLITALLQREGLRVEAHGSAGEALEAMDPARPPVLVVTALQLPGVDGWKFCRLLRSPEFAAFNAVPVLVISGTFAGPETSRLMAEWGVDAFIPLPVDPATFSCQVQGLLQGERLTKRARVLLVEDSRSQAAFLRATFVDAGWEADTAGTLEEAREAFGREIYDVAVLDYHLPDGTGDALLAAFRRERPDCICLMMTPDPEPGLALAWMRQGAADYLRKPFDPQFLLERCARARRERTLLGLEERLEERTRQLRVSEARLRATLDQTPNVAVQMYDAEGRVTYWNPAAETLYGWKGEEVLGRTLDTFLLGPEEAAQFRRLKQKMILKLNF